MFSVTGVDPGPSSLDPLTAHARKVSATSGCDYIGSADVASCIRIAAPPQPGRPTPPLSSTWAST